MKESVATVLRDLIAPLEKACDVARAEMLDALVRNQQAGNTNEPEDVETYLKVCDLLAEIRFITWKKQEVDG